MRRIDRLKGRSEERFGFSDYMSYLGHQYPLTGMPAPQTTWGKDKAEPIGNDFQGMVEGAYKRNGVVFACVLARMLLFTEATFAYRKLNNGRPGDFDYNPSLRILEKPWPNGTTGDLLGRMEQDVSMAGNAFIALTGAGPTKRLKRLRPDWTDIIVGSTSGDPHDLDGTPLGYLYYPGGNRNNEPTSLLPDVVAHFAPIPDPTAEYRGMSWLSSVVTEIQADQMASRHKLKFFENAATPNLAVSLDKAISEEAFRKFVDIMKEQHTGSENAYRTLYTAGGADVKVIGADFKQLDFKVTQGAGETRICSAAGVPAIIVGLSEGLESGTYSNYGQARRKFGDHWARPQWRNAAASLAHLVPVPDGHRLDYDDRDIAFLQEDRKDAAEIAQVTATTIRTYTDAGYTPESAVAAVLNEDPNLLVHSGLYSVQLQAPGSTPAPTT